MKKSFGINLPIINLFILLIFFSFCGCKSETPPKHNADSKQSQEHKTEKKTSLPIELDTETACKAEVSRSLQIVGSFAADTTVNLAPQINGKILRVNARLGDSVQKDQILVEIDPTDIELQIKLNRANLQQQLALLGMTSPDQPLPDKQMIPDVKKAKVKADNDLTTYNRKIQERNQDLISDQELDNAKTIYMSSKADYENQLFYADRNFAAVQTSKSQLDISLRDLVYTKVRSPLDGFVLEQKVYDGDYITKGSIALVLVSSSPLLLNIDIPQKYSGLFERGKTLVVSTDAVSGKSFTGEICYISPVSSPDSRSVKVQARIDNPAKELKPGMFGKIDLIYAKDTVLLVPQKAVIEFKGISKVFKIDESTNTAVEVTVHKGDLSGDWVEVSGDLKAGDLIAVTSAASLDNGVPVKIQKKGAARPPRMK